MRVSALLIITIYIILIRVTIKGGISGSIRAFNISRAES
jgi:hypothetical protein